jgi:hypothetical protein
MVDEVARDFDLQEADLEPAPKPALGSGIPVLVDHPLLPLTKASGEKKN